MQMHAQTDSLATVSALVDDPWLTLQQGAKYVQAHEATLRREMKAGRLRFAKVGGRKSIRLRRSWLDAWLEGSTRPVEVA
jgi:excisionase family DNA binding protein